MKKQYLILVAICMSLLLTACGMSTEEITTYMTSLDKSYQSGAYEQAITEIKKLDKSYKKMTDEQKVKFDELKPLVEYASASVGAINEGLNNAQSFYDQKLYYEASQELEKVSTAYTLPPAEQKVFDEKKAAVDNGIKSVKATEVLQKVESLLNSGDYNAASNELGNVDTSALSEEQNQKYQSLLTQITEAKARAEAEAKAKAEAAKKQADDNGVMTESKARQLALNQIEAKYRNDCTAVITGEDSHVYYVDVLWDNKILASYMVNKRTRDISQTYSFY